MQLSAEIFIIFYSVVLNLLSTYVCLRAYYHCIAFVVIGSGLLLPMHCLIHSNLPELILMLK